MTKYKFSRFLRSCYACGSFKRIKTNGNTFHMFEFLFEFALTKDTVGCFVSSSNVYIYQNQITTHLRDKNNHFCPIFRWP